MKAVRINGIMALANVPWGHNKALKTLMRGLGLEELPNEADLEFGFVDAKINKVVFVDDSYGRDWRY